MRATRWMGTLAAMGLMLVSVACAMAKPPQSDADKAALIQTMYDGFRGMFEGVPEVTVAELQPMLDDPGVVVVDVRPAAERGVSMIAGAVSSETFEADPSAYAGKTIVAYCTIGYRSGLWAKDQRAAGVDARNLVGSLLSWTHAGGALVADGAPTRRVHVYGSRWNLAAEGYEATW